MALSERTANYIEDDWEDNSYQSRTNTETGYFLYPKDTLISDNTPGNVLKGFYRPRWEVRQAAGTVSSSNGRFILSRDSGGGNISVATSSNATIGAFFMTYAQTTKSSHNDASFCAWHFALAPSDNDRLSIGSDRFDNRYYLKKVDNGTSTNLVFTNQFPDDSNFHDMRADIGVGNERELFLDGVSMGTASDPFTPVTTRTEFFVNETDLVAEIEYMEVCV